MFLARIATRELRSVVVFVFALTIFSGMASAQFGTGTLNGTVSDPTGAVIPSASLTLTDVETNASRKIVTDQRGRYSVPDLGIGQYRLQAEAAGFGVATREGIQVTVGAQLTVNFSLIAGQITSSVTVTTDVQNQVNSTSGEQSTLIDPKQIRDLPLNGRNFEQLILLAPGVQPAQAAARTSTYGRAPSYSISGARPEGQEVLIDGANIEGFWNRGTGASIIGTSLGVEAIAEFQTLTGIYGAQFGGNGAVINAVTKSGTNKIHGSLYDYLRNSVFDARNYFDPLNRVPSFRRNQFGGSIGGPLHKDKLFFFLNYEGLRQQLGETLAFNTPDQNAHDGYLPCAVTGTTTTSLTNPCGQATNVGPNNRPGLAYVGVRANVAPFLALLPLPNGPAIPNTGTGVLTQVANNPANEDYFHARLDQVLSAKDNLAFRYISDNGNLIDPYPGPLAGFPEVSIQRNRFATIEEKHIFSPKLLNTVRFHFTQSGQAARQQGKDPRYAPFQFLPNAQYGSYAISSLIPSGAGNSGIGTGSATPQGQRQKRFVGQDDVYLSVASHQLQFGIDATRTQSFSTVELFGSGQYTFPTLVSFLSGTPSLVLIALPGSDAVRNAREWDISPYIQDDWKVSSRLSVNMGVRYEFVTLPTETRNKWQTILNPRTDTAYTPERTAFGNNPSLTNIDPRVGFSYTPGSLKTAIRGGFGIYHNPVAARTYSSSQSLSPPFQNRTIVNPSFPNPLAGGALSVPFNSNLLPFNSVRTPYQMQYSLGVQQQIDSATVLTLSYVGNLGRHLFYSRELNPTISQICPCSDPNNPLAATLPAGTRYHSIANRGYTRGNPSFGNLNYAIPGGTSSYNALQTSLVHSLSHGIQFQVNYTWSKVLDYSSLSNGIEEGDGSGSLQNLDNFRLEYGPAAFDVRNLGNANVLYAIPKHGSSRLLNGWEGTALVQLRTGVPYSVVEGMDRVNFNNSFILERPNQVGNPNLAGTVAANPTCAAPTVIHTVANWYNPCAFVAQPVGTVGNEPRNQLTAPGFKNFDMGLIKNTLLRDNVNLELRAEFFNIFNHTNLGFPNLVSVTGANASAPNPGNPTAYNPSVQYNGAAGQITTTNGTSRQIQFSFKLLF